MSFLIFDGFEHNSLACWDSSSGIAVQGSFPRTGSYGMQIYRTGWLIKAFPSASVTGAVFGFAFYDPGGVQSRRIAGIYGEYGHHGGIGYNAATKKFYAANYFGSAVAYTTNAINTGTWYYVEFKIVVGDAASGSVEILVDGIQELNETTGDYRNGSTFVYDARIGSSSNANEYCYFDDAYILLSDGVGQLTYLGDCIIHASLPDADGSSSQWSRSGGSSDYENIDEGDPNDDTDYLYTPDGESTVLVSVGTFSDVGREILAVQETMYTAKTGPGLAVTCAPVCKSGVTTDVGTEFSPVLGYLPTQEIHSVDPNTSSAWTLTNLNAVEWGIKTTTGQYAVRSGDDLDDWLDDPGTVTLS